MLGTKGVGIDIVELRRIEGIPSKERFAEFAFTENERNQLAKRADKIAFIASRFATKEAVIKAFPSALTMQDFEICKKGVKPVVHFFDSAYNETYRVHISLTHSSDYAAGYAMVERI